MITVQNYQDKIKELNEYGRLYALGKPVVSDAIYDQMYREMEDFEHSNPDLVDSESPTKKIESDLSKGFEKVKHEFPMISIDKTFSYDGVKDFIRKTNEKIGYEGDYVRELKVDGAGVSLIFQEGNLVDAITRGSNGVGDRVIQNILRVSNIPKTIPVKEKVTIRGEILIKNSDFEYLNKKQQDNGEPLYANPRNLAAGSLKQLDSEESAKRRLSFVAYVVLTPDLSVPHNIDLENLEKWGFETPIWNCSKNPEDIVKGCEEIHQMRINKEIDYNIDGIVIKLCQKHEYAKIGSTGKFSKHQIAYKFPSEEAIVKIESVTFGVGRSGVVTPVFNFGEGVLLDGSVVKNATAHNFDEISRLGVQIGDLCVLTKRGDIIPKIMSVFEKGKNRTPILPPEFCPACETGKVEQVNGEVVYKCTNPDCSAKILGKFKHFVSKHSMDMFGLSEKILEQLIDLELVSDFADLYDLTEEMLIAKVPRMGKKKAENFVNAVQTSKNRGLAKLLVGLSIPNCGENTCKNLANEFKSIDVMLETPFEKYLEIPDVGSTTARSIFDYFASDENIRLIERLKERGIKMTVEETRKTGNSLEGKVFCVTGTLSVPRKQIEQLIEANGGRCASMSKSVNFLIAGEDCGSKLDKAEKLGIPVIDESALMEMIGQGNDE